MFMCATFRMPCIVQLCNVFWCATIRMSVYSVVCSVFGILLLECLNVVHYSLLSLCFKTGMTCFSMEVI